MPARGPRHRWVSRNPTHAETVRSEADARMQMTDSATGFFRGTSRGARIGSVGFAITGAGAVVAVVGTLTDRSWLHWAALALACVGILIAFVGIIYHTVEFFARMRSR